MMDLETGLNKLLPLYHPADERIRRLEAQFNRVMWDPRMSALLQGEFPVTESKTGLRRVGDDPNENWHSIGTIVAMPNSTTSWTPGANTIFCLPFVVNEPIRVDALGWKANNVAGNWRGSIYGTRKDPPRSEFHLYPGRKVPNSHTQQKTVTSGTNKHFYASTLSLSRGLYWGALEFSSGSLTCYRVEYEKGNCIPFLGRDDPAGTSDDLIGWRIQCDSFVGLPDTMFTSGVLAIQRWHLMPAMYIRVA